MTRLVELFDELDVQKTIQQKPFTLTIVSVWRGKEIVRVPFEQWQVLSGLSNTKFAQTIYNHFEMNIYFNESERHEAVHSLYNFILQNKASSNFTLEELCGIRLDVGNYYMRGNIPINWTREHFDSAWD
jgi:hypothetical protein